MKMTRGRIRWHIPGKALFASLLALLLWQGAAPGSSPTVTVHLQRGRTTLEEPVTLVLRIEGSRETPEVVPEDSPEVILTPRGQSTSVQIVNGVQSMHQDLYYAVLPQREGTLTIPPLELRFPSGKVMRTDTLSLEVTKRSGTPEKETTQGSQAPGGASRKAFVAASLSKERVYAGEPVTYRFSFFRALPAGESRLTPPDFGSLPWEALEREVYRTEIDGTLYVVTEIPFLLSPVLPGEASISSAALDVVLGEENSRQELFSGAFPGDLFPSSLEDFFRFSPSRGRPYHLETEPLSLEVLPLPPRKEVPPFSGLVGSADMRCILHPREAKTGEPLELTVLVRGKGNMRDLQAPELLLPKEIKVYENSPEESLRPGVEGYEGIRAFSWSLIPLREGSWDLPPVQLALFDPQAERYEILEASIPSFSARGAPLSEEIAAPDSPEEPSSLPKEPPRKEPSEEKEDLPPLREVSLKAPEDVLPLPSARLFLGLLLAPPALLGLFLGGAEIRKRRNTLKRQMIRRSQRSLREALKTRKMPKKLDLLKKSLTWGIFARINRQGELLTSSLLKELENRELTLREAQEASDFLTRLEKLLYGENASLCDASALESFERELARFVRRLWK
jgi:hypothetical protein